MQTEGTIRYAARQDLPALCAHDTHVLPAEWGRILAARRALVLYEGDAFTGWLRFGLFWDEIPFMNLLYILEGHRGNGHGTALVSFWEKEMAQVGHRRVLTSTQADEQAQFFYRKLGYTECGALLLPAQPMELFFIKELQG